MKTIGTLCLSMLISSMAIAQQSLTKEVAIPLPSAPQLQWQQKERIMFLHYSPAAWQGREYDNWSTPLEQIRLSAIDTDQWCEVAQSWGAKMIIFVAKHCGGFCWWQTQTSDYGIRNTPWMNGKGDVMKNISESCKKYGLDLGVYVYPGDEHWGAGIGSGGITEDPTKQEAYNAVYRQQLTELLTQYGPIREVWFDGNCHVQVEDLVKTLAPEAVVFQGKAASLRWVGNEDGYAPDPNWYTLSKEDLATGVATALHSDVNGDAYAPVEVDVPFLKNGGHKWFWTPNADSLLMTGEQLMNLYYKSVGRGSVLLLNATPDTSGLIPESHVKVYQAFGREIASRFDKPLARTKGKTRELVIDLKNPTVVNHTILREDLASGQRVTAYRIEGTLDGKQWKLLYKGTSVGNKKIDYFPDATVKQIRVVVEKDKALPQLADFSVYRVKSKLEDIGKETKDKAVNVGYWEANTFDTEWQEVVFDLTPYMNAIGEYELNFSMLSHDYLSKEPCGLEFKDWKLMMYGNEMPALVSSQNKNQTYRITRSQQTLDEYPTTFTVKIKSKPGKSAGEVLLKRLTY